jgi:hypothetical protein
MTLRARLRSPWTWLWVALAVALVVRAGVRDRGVIADHLEFGRRLLLGLDLYAPYLDPGPLHAPYPPSFGLWTAPFWALGERAARWLWAALQVLALWRIGGLLRATQLVWLVTLLIASRYVLRDLHGGGGNTFQLLFALEACALAAAGRARLAGWVLGFGLATKPTQALLVPYLWLCGQRRAAMHALLASTAFAGFALLLHGGGLEPWRRWLEGTFAYATQQDLFAEPAHGWPAFTWMNQCLRCMVHRWLGDVPGSLAAEVPGWVPGLGLPGALVAGVALGLALALLALTLRHVARSTPPPHAVLVLSVLVSPIAWKAHHVVLLPALGVAVQQRRWLFLLLYVALCGIGEELVGKDLKNLQQSLYLTTLGSLALLALLLRRPPGVSSSSPRSAG